ncbi:MAG: efflux RND transporter periplasmic adaptor subunit [Armatimonadota bacterium]
MKKIIIAIVLIVLLLGGLYGLSQYRKPKPPVPTSAQIWKQTGIPVNTTVLARGEMVQTIAVTGDITALNSAVVSPKISARLTSISIHEGDTVSKGQVVAVLDQGDPINALESARASLEASKARLAQAVTYSEVTKTQTQSVIEQANASLRSALAKLEVAKRPSRSQDRMVAENKVASAKANLDKAQADFNRNDRLLKRGAISESAFDVFKTQYAVSQSDYKTANDQLSLIAEGGRKEDITSSESQVEMARQQLREAKANASQNLVKEKDILTAKTAVLQAQAAVDTAKRQLDNTYIKASISGVVATRTADPGQVVSPGQTLATIVDLGSVYLKGDVSEKYLGSVSNGQSVSVRIEAFPGKTLTGRITEINPAGSTVNRNFSVRITINTAGLKIKPGMFASGDIKIDSIQNVLLVPKDALDDRKGVQSVYTAGKDKKAKRHLVSVLSENRDYVQLAKPFDLKAGDTVVTQGHTNIEDGTLLELDSGEAVNVVN